MDSPDSSPITGLLLRWGAGEKECLNELVPLVDKELRRIAHYLMRKEQPAEIAQFHHLRDSRKRSSDRH